MNKITILLADDDQEDMELLEEAILDIRPDVQLLKVNNGKAALDFLDAVDEDELPVLIVLDYNIPELNGAQVLKLIAEHDRLKNIPRVILSTSNAGLYINESKANGATDYFVKPDTKPGLDELAKRMLAMVA